MLITINITHLFPKCNSSKTENTLKSKEYQLYFYRGYVSLSKIERSTMKSHNVQRTFCCRTLWLLSKQQIHEIQAALVLARSYSRYNTKTILTGPQKGPTAMPLPQSDLALTGRSKIKSTINVVCNHLTEHSGYSHWVKLLSTRPYSMNLHSTQG